MEKQTNASTASKVALASLQLPTGEIMENETFVDFPACPHCGTEDKMWYVTSPTWDSPNSAEKTCTVCGEEYFLERVVKYSFKTRKKVV